MLGKAEFVEALAGMSLNVPTAQLERLFEMADVDRRCAGSFWLSGLSGVEISFRAAWVRHPKSPGSPEARMRFRVRVRGDAVQGQG